VSTPAVQATGLVRRFDDLVAVREVDFTVPEGKVVGLIGPDGAGKTTLIRMMVGVLAPTKGTVSICGHDVQKERDKTRLLLGYMSQAFGLYTDLTVAENIKFFARLRLVKRKDRLEREKRLLEFTRLAPFVKRHAGKLSGGMKQKLGLICTLLHEPRVLFLDEPTNGVDPVSRREFWDILGELRGRVTVVVATPYMDEAERCDLVALMSDGRILAYDSPERLRARITDPVWEVETDRPFAAAELLTQAMPWCDVQLFGDMLHLLGPQEPSAALAVLREAGHTAQARQVPPSMEDAYVYLATQGEQQPEEAAS
jgi:ABC-2 type transport system ATP-binding protein